MTPFTLSRVHVSFEVTDLERSIAFYRLLLGAEPVKVRPGYAKFGPRDPSVNLSLVEAANAAPWRGGGHFGIEVGSSEAVRGALERLRAAGLAPRIEERVGCCYSVQDKVWAEDPDGRPWEVFHVVEADAPDLVPSGSACCAPGSGCGG